MLLSYDGFASQIDFLNYNRHYQDDFEYWIGLVGMNNEGDPLWVSNFCFNNIIKATQSFATLPGLTSVN